MPSRFSRGRLAARALASSVFVASCYASGDPPIDGSTGGDPDTGGGGTPLLTYWISETTNFAQSGLLGCGNSSLNQVRNQLKTLLDGDGWSGTYVLNNATTRRDFADNTVLVGGRDQLAADNAALAVYAGHGNIDALQWGNPDAANQCGLTLSSSMRLGQASGDVARLAIFVTSCTLNVPNLQTTVGVSSTGQYLGWHNSPAVPDWVLSDFYDSTDTFILGDGPVTNRLAWMSVGQVKPGLGANSPTIFTEQGEDDDVAFRHFNAQLAAGIGVDEVIPEMPNDKFRVTWIDNGSCP